MLCIILDLEVLPAMAMICEDSWDETLIGEEGFTEAASINEDISENTLVPTVNRTYGIRVDRVPCEIKEGLYLGSVGAARNKDILRRLNITHVLTLRKSSFPAYPNDFTYKSISVDDTRDTNIAQYFDDCFDYIHEAISTGGGVLVHCYMGISRSATIVVAYLMKKHAMTLTEALIHIKSKRPRARPNSGFFSQLKTFENSLKDIMPLEKTESEADDSTLAQC